MDVRLRFVTCQLEGERMAEICHESCRTSSSLSPTVARMGEPTQHGDALAGRSAGETLAKAREVLVRQGDDRREQAGPRGVPQGNRAAFASLLLNAEAVLELLGECR